MLYVYRNKALLLGSLLLLNSCKNPFLSLKPEDVAPEPSPLSENTSTHGGDGSGHHPGLEGLKRLGGKSLNMGPASTNNKVVVTLPRDRCKAGTITFGNTKCQAIGRGLTSHSGPRDSRYVKGEHSDGRPCWYLDPKYSKGATPQTTFTMGSVRPMGRDKTHWGQAGISLNDNVPNRSGFAIHSVKGFLESTNAEVQNGHGCVRISQECMKKLHEYRRSGMPVEVNNI